MFLSLPGAITRSLRPTCTLRSNVVLHSLGQSRWFGCGRRLCAALGAEHTHSKPTPSISRFSILTTSPEGLLNRLKAPDAKLRAKLDGRSLMVLLFTPSFAHLLGNDSHFLHAVVSGSLQGAERGVRIDVLAAVVDAIPVSDSGPSLQREFHEESAAGTDGLSACLIESMQSDSLWDTKPPGISRTEPNLPGRLSFLVETPIRDGVEPSIDMLYRITLPLPNTVFQNGELQTLKALSYEVNSIGTDQFPQMELKDAHNLLDYTLRLDSGTLKALAAQTAKEDDLVPLTHFRRVAESMGNILRRLEDTDSEGGQITASHELEVSLRQWKERPFEIWAEIIPHEQWQNSSTGIDDLPFISRLEQGHRFARVLSGGGGWGARAGLLSLDPETIPYKSTNTSTLNSQGSELPFALPDFVRKGDFIRYLLIPNPLSENLADSDMTDHSEVSKLSRPATYEFGSGIRQDAEDEESPVSTPADTTFTASFGALSRKPASIEIVQTITRNSSSPKRQQALVQTLLPPRATVGFG